MTTSTSRPSPACGHELRFLPLLPTGREYAIPCDAAGRVELDALSPTELMDYLYARAVIGHEFRPPAVSSGAGQQAVHH